MSSWLLHLSVPPGQNIILVLVYSNVVYLHGKTPRSTSIKATDKTVVLLILIIKVLDRRPGEKHP